MPSEFVEKPSLLHTQAVAALRALMGESGEVCAAQVLAAQAYAEAVAKTVGKAYRKSRKLRAAAGHFCHHQLAGKRCPEMTCHSPGDIPGHDHLSEWKSVNGARVIVSQPYWFNYETMKETVAFWEKHGLRADISANWSRWYPGQTLMVEYEKDRDE